MSSNIWVCDNFYVLGALDPEMKAIETLLSDAGLSFGYAMKDGARCHAGNAYLADACTEEIDIDAEIIFIECEISLLTAHKVIDHHRPGDFGYNMDPDHYWQGSSIGQLCEHLNITKTPELKTIAALDHCYYAACQGLCPGVSASVVNKLKYQEIATSWSVDLQVIENIIAAFKEKIINAQRLTIGTQQICDLRDINISELYSLGYLVLQCALYEMDECALILFPEKSRRKVILSGNVRADTVMAFIHQWSKLNELHDCYGVPQRGYAGGYLE